MMVVMTDGVESCEAASQQLLVIVGTSFVAGLSGILGMSLVGRELSEKRMSFYFARPLSPARHRRKGPPPQVAEGEQPSG